MNKTDTHLPAIARAAAMLALGWLFAASASAQSVPGSRLLVMPFSVQADPTAPGGAGATLWLGEAAAMLLSEELQDLGVGAFSRDERVAAFERLQVLTPSNLTRATTIRVGELLDASEVVFGEVRLTDKASVRVRMIQLDEGRQLPEVVDEAPLVDIFRLFERVAQSVGRLTGRPLSPLRHAQDHPSLEAFENYVKGLVAVTPRAQQRFLELAFQQAPRDARILLAMWSVYTEQGLHDKALASARNVPVSSPATRKARFSASLSLLALNRFEEASKELTSLMAERASPVVSNALGVVQLRRGGAAMASAPALFQRAVEAAPGNTDFLFNLGYAYALAHDAQPALLWLREAVRFDATSGDAHLVMSAVLQSEGKTVEAQRELDLAKLLGTKRDVSAAVLVDKIPAGLERLPDDVDGSLAIDMVGTPAQREQEQVATFHLEQGRRLFAEKKDRDAINELRRAIYLSPYQDEPHLLVGRLYQRAGRIAEAIDEFKVAIWCRETAEARVALGTALLDSGDKPGARREADRALVLKPDDASAKDLARKAGG
jgi:tetratricopeptide (TPR) repeat protein